MKLVSSRDNPDWKMLVRLCHSSRDRRKSGKCVLEGAHTIAAYLERYGIPELIVVNEEARDDGEIRGIVLRAGSRQVMVADARLFGELAQTAAPTGVLAVIAAPQPGSLAPGAFNLLLEDVQDPGNVGTMLRTAAAAGVTHAFLSAGCAFAWSPKVLRAGQGAHFFLDIVEHADLPALARDFNGKVVAAVPRAPVSLFDADLRGPLMFVVGNEGAGLSPALIASATAQVAIPMPGGFESLNAASAAAVCLFEKLRQEGNWPRPQTAF
ncbi:MAG: RNA methyltransferase [Burkholderiales bacterium]|nr:RNA methyltransferase [Burkholderiales bacterium]